MSHYPSDTFWRGAANRDCEEEAFGWIVRMNSGSVTEQDRSEFAVWNEHPDNATAYTRATRLWNGLGPILETHEAAGWPNATPSLKLYQRARTGIPRLAKYASLAASLALVVLSTTQYLQVWQYDQVTGSAVRNNVVMEDGSSVTMGPGTAFDADFSNGGRHISLARGEAYFDVRHNAAHPFVVSVGNGVVRVLGTAFTVRRQDDGTVTVTVTRGRVQVTSGADSETLVADRQIGFGPDGLGKIRAIDSSLATAWIGGRLIMEDRPLGEVLEELDRYDSKQIILLNREASQRRINAVIDLHRTDSWLTALASSQGLKFSRVGSLEILR